MSIVDSLTSRLGRPAGRALEPTLRDLVQAVLKEQGYASPAEVQGLRDEVREVRTRVAGLATRLDEAVQAATAAREAAAAAREAAKVAPPPVDTAPLYARIAALEAQLGAAPAATPAEPLVADPAEPCSVPGCGGPVRSKGYCSAHYQQWRRGTLKAPVSG